jgi:putative intracellular protease/amidase
VFYKALGFAVWKLGIAYVRRRYARKAKIAAVLGLAALVVAAGYFASRSSE